MPWDLGPLLVQGGPSALLGVAILAILRGWLVPRQQLLRELGYRDRTIAALEATVAEQKTQIGILLARLPERAS